MTACVELSLGKHNEPNDLSDCARSVDKIVASREQLDENERTSKGAFEFTWHVVETANGKDARLAR